MKIGNGKYGVPGAGSDAISKFGENSDIDTADAPVEVWSHGANGTRFPFIDTGIPMDIKSSSADDTLLGIGGQQATLTFYRTDNTKVVKTVDLDGITQVEIDDDVKICTRIQIKSGTNKTNVGEINIVDRATGLVVYQSVEIGEGQTLSAIQICEKDKKGKIKFHYTTFSRASAAFGSAQMRLRLRAVDGSILTKYNTTISANHPRDERTYGDGFGLDIVEGEIFFWECTSVSANDTPIEAGFDLMIEDV